MRLVQVAKALGMTGQQLRHELEQVEFGVKPSDREVPDQLAQGIIRFVARKHGLKIDLEALGLSDSDEEAADAGQAAALANEPSAETASPAAAKARPSEEAVTSDSLKVLRKLTLEDVSPEAIEKEKQRLVSQPRKTESAGGRTRRVPQPAAPRRRLCRSRSSVRKARYCFLPNSPSRNWRKRPASSCRRWWRRS